MSRILILRLEGVLQSWGLRSRWNGRDSGLFPSKSGLVGLLACAMGLRRDDRKIASLQNALQLAVRADKPGKLLWDYQTITRFGARLNASTGSQRTMEGTIKLYHHQMMMDEESRASGIGIRDTIISQRQYLQDASFTAFISGPDDLLEASAKALQAPKWQIYLGRKSCPPCTPVFLELTDQYQTLLEAASGYPLRQGSTYPVLCEIDSPQGKTLRQDLVIKSGTDYAYRRLDMISLKGDA
ncbi:MAG: type I-E CRISPR-associated protein Cas5/CasD [Clostridiales bacterium]|nr:type I-E CRISPR-associated protein Cas5/CasD [Clostridiales bacterium]